MLYRRYGLCFQYLHGGTVDPLRDILSQLNDTMYKSKDQQEQHAFLKELWIIGNMMRINYDCQH